MAFFVIAGVMVLSVLAGMAILAVHFARQKNRKMLVLLLTAFAVLMALLYFALARFITSM